MIRRKEEEDEWRGGRGVTNEGQKRPTSNHNLSRGREGEDENDIVSDALSIAIAASSSRLSMR